MRELWLSWLCILRLKERTKYMQNTLHPIWTCDVMHCGVLEYLSLCFFSFVFFRGIAAGFIFPQIRIVKKKLGRAYGGVDDEKEEKKYDEI